MRAFWCIKRISVETISLRGSNIRCPRLKTIFKKIIFIMHLKIGGRGGRSNKPICNYNSITMIVHVDHTLISTVLSLQMCLNKKLKTVLECCPG